MAHQPLHGANEAVQRAMSVVMSEDGFGVEAGDERGDMANLMARAEAAAYEMYADDYGDFDVEDTVDSGSTVEEGVQGTLEEVSATTSMVVEYGSRVQRLCAVRRLGEYGKGRLPTVASIRGYAGPLPTMMWAVRGSVTVHSIAEGGGIYDRLKRNERVVTQVVAKTGLGKTTVFPSKIAMECGLRVLQLEPDHRLAAQAKRSQLRTGVVGRRWSKERQALLVTMSYQDCMGKQVGEDGRRMLDQFDVVYMDEAHMAIADIEAMKYVLATRAPSSLSVLVVSATLADGEDVQASAGVTKMFTAQTPAGLIENGNLLHGKYSRGRTGIIVANDEEAALLAEKVRAAGAAVKVLDSASTVADVELVHDFLREPDALVSRFVVCTREYGTGHNLPLQSVVVGGWKDHLVLSDDGTTLEKKSVRIDKTELRQQCGRVDRGMASGALAIICGSEADFTDEVVLDDEYHFRLYALLVAAGQIPPPAVVKNAEKMFPTGLTKEMAIGLLSSRLPVTVAVRYFAADGRVPKAWLRPLEVYADDGYQYPVSRFDTPLHYEKWVAEGAGCFYGEPPKEGNVTLTVPMHATGDLKVAIQAIALMKAKAGTVVKWMASFNEEDTSADEKDGVSTTAEGIYVPRQITDKPRATVSAVESRFVYSYNAMPVRPRDRQALLVEDDGIKAVMRALDADTTLTEFKARCGVAEFADKRGNDRVVLTAAPGDGVESPVELNSPGGSKVAILRKSVWEKLSQGKPVVAGEAKSLFAAVRSDIDGFVASDAFSGWSPVWDGVLLTLMDGPNMVEMQRNKMIERASALLLGLAARYAAGVHAVAKNSHVKMSWVTVLLRSSDRTYAKEYDKQRAAGNVKVAQSDAFLKRLRKLRELMIQVVQIWEEANWYVPMVTAKLQDMMPIFKRVGSSRWDEPATSGRYYTLRHQ